jgi:hypothetical protein
MNPALACRRGAVGSVLLVAACQPLPHPFANDVPKPGSPMLTLRDTDTVAVAPLEGGPRATAKKLAPAMAEALQKRDIAASDRTMSIASYQLDGRIQAMPASGGKAAIIVSWDLRDASGKSLGNRAERLEGTADDWQRGRDDAVARLADTSAEQIAAMLQGKTPAEAAGPGAIAAPGEAAAPDHTAELGKAAEPGKAAALGEAAVPGGATAPGKTAAPDAAAAPAAPHLLIGGVKGAPGDGGAALVSAITTLLKRQDLAIVSDPHGKADLLLDAEVSIAKPEAGQQHVKIVWRVRRRDGSEIGTVAQENDVPAGLLNGSWADVAYSVALAAQDGIMQLIARGLPQSAGNS